jgi:hypothetical protein
MSEGVVLRRELDLEGLVLLSGKHKENQGMCVMEAVAYVAGEPWSDNPACACPMRIERRHPADLR